MAFLIPDNIITTKNGLKIKQKIIPNTLVAKKDIATYVRKGQKMKPCAKLNNDTGKPKGITVHNTADIKVPIGTTAAEQYVRATYAGNMKGVVVHFYVWDKEIWQELAENERGWHAADGRTRRASQRGGTDLIGGNLDTIAIECIGDRALSEDTTAKLVAYLCEKYNLNPSTDVYTHQYFKPTKKCPLYIIPHWDKFLTKVKEYYQIIKKKPATNNDTKNGVENTTTKEFRVKVVCSALNIRKSNSVFSKIVGTAKKNEIYSVVQVKGNWGKLKSNMGWINIKPVYVKKV